MTEYWDGTGITPEDLEAEVIRLAAEQPDHVYSPTKFYGTLQGEYTPSPWCRYTHIQEDGAPVPGCIIGQAIFNLSGKPVDQDTSQGTVCDFPFMQGEYIVPGWSQRAKFLSYVQSKQDAGMSWGQAVAEAQLKYSGKTS
jgi:hypothetical protein